MKLKKYEIFKIMNTVMLKYKEKQCMFVGYPISWGMKCGSSGSIQIAPI